LTLHHSGDDSSEVRGELGLLLKCLISGSDWNMPCSQEVPKIAVPVCSSGDILDIRRAPEIFQTFAKLWRYSRHSQSSGESFPQIFKTQVSLFSVMVSGDH